MLSKLAFYNQGAAYSEIGKCLGLGPMGRTVRILVPMALPSFFLGMLLVLMEVISDYGTVTTLGVRTLTVGVYDIWFSMFTPKLAIQISLFLILIPLGVIVWFSRYSRNL